MPGSSPSSPDHSTRFGKPAVGVEFLAQRQILVGPLGVGAGVAFRVSQQRAGFQPPEVERRNSGPLGVPLVDDSMRLGEVVDGSPVDRSVTKASPGKPAKNRLPPPMCSVNEARRSLMLSSRRPLRAASIARSAPIAASVMAVTLCLLGLSEPTTECFDRLDAR